MNAYLYHNNTDNNNNSNNKHREELKDPDSVHECLQDRRPRCETLVRMENISHTEKECTLCKQGFTVEMANYSDTECLTTYRDGCRWVRVPNRNWSRDVKSERMLLYGKKVDRQEKAERHFLFLQIPVGKKYQINWKSPESWFRRDGLHLLSIYFAKWDSNCLEH